MQIPYKPLWFKEEDDGSGESHSHGGNKDYKPTGEYWERRSRCDWRGLPELY